MIDKYFHVDVLERTPGPQVLAWQAMHQDYSETYVATEDPPSESEAGERIIRHLFAGDRGHYGPLEHPSITFAVGWFPHSVMQQARTHRVGVSFDVQSMRYTGYRICAVANSEVDVEEVFYLRPVGEYRDRQGKRYSYTETHRARDLQVCYDAAVRYSGLLRAGFAEEHARGTLPFDYRQHFVVTFSMRALMHFLDLRAKKDAQDEIRCLCDMLMPHFQTWAPEVCDWYAKNRFGRAKLAP